MRLLLATTLCACCIAPLSADQLLPAESIVYIEARRAPNSDHDKVEVSRGTGFIFKEGYLLTAAHVVFDDLPEYTESHVVSFGSRYNHSYPVSVIKIDRDLDLALLSLPENIDARMRPLRKGDSNAVANGERITAYGFPGKLDLTISEGILSSKRVPPRSYWLTTMGINRGQSGGPVFNNNGEWVAVAIAGQDDMSKVTYAIPASFANSLIALVASRTPARPAALPIRTLDFHFASIGDAGASLASSTQRACLPRGFRVAAAVPKDTTAIAEVTRVDGASNCVDVALKMRTSSFVTQDFEIIGGNDDVSEQTLKGMVANLPVLNEPDDKF